MATSRLQRYTSQQLSIHFGGYTIRENHRPDWLNSGNGGNLELDFYIEELNLAIEVQGQQHWQFVPMFHIDIDGYNAQIKRDKKKKDVCLKRGVKLVEVFSKRDIDSLIRGYFYTEPYVETKQFARQMRAFISLPVQQQLKTTSKEENIDKKIERAEKIEKKLIIRRQNKVEKYMNFFYQLDRSIYDFKKRGSINKKLRYIKKHTDDNKFIEFIGKSEIPKQYLDNLFQE